MKPILTTLALLLVAAIIATAQQITMQPSIVWVVVISKFSLNH